jgi:hypothetical protein
MTIDQYQSDFETILTTELPHAPYNNPDYFQYAKMNQSRSNRWFKHGKLSSDTITKIKSIQTPQTWILITEHWCGDAAHSIPFIAMMAALNPMIQLEVQLRDSDSEIDSYLTNGGKSIPILVLRDENGKDLAVWGPRPAACQVLYLEMKNAGKDFETQKIVLQNWYNANKGLSIQAEICALL